MAGPTVCETWWSAIVTSFEKNHDDLIAGHPDCTEGRELLRTALLTIEQLIHISPPRKRKRRGVEGTDGQSEGREESAL
jgi:hypothetical protein